jgi:hypothetical protein
MDKPPSHFACLGEIMITHLPKQMPAVRGFQSVCGIKVQWRQHRLGRIQVCVSEGI